MTPVDYLQLALMALLAWVVYRLHSQISRRPAWPREQEDEAREDLSEVEQRLARLLKQSRETLAEDLDVLARIRREIEQRSTVASGRAEDEPVGPADPPESFLFSLPEEGDGEDSEGGQRPRTAVPRAASRHSDVLELLSAGHDCEEVARRLGRSPSEVRLVQHLAARRNS